MFSAIYIDIHPYFQTVLVDGQLLFGLLIFNFLDDGL